ncbi:hypothetical protein CFOL_v3_35717 [Cephalotus follicularis]|uniref:Uncharacterized protein n=1 Tax=Cephalotus follicularis TaxID=3775 RepID=A0A1Q3DJE2_CEPFO|nr:hypothetical protein CFOL_v3_35717 [Cephalotus follicularis]
MMVLWQMFGPAESSLNDKGRGLLNDTLEKLVALFAILMLFSVFMPPATTIWGPFNVVLARTSILILCDQMFFSELMKEASEIAGCFSSRVRHLLHLYAATGMQRYLKMTNKAWYKMGTC